jgi:hypothetical protein
MAIEKGKAAAEARVDEGAEMAAPARGKAGFKERLIFLR